MYTYYVFLDFKKFKLVFYDSPSTKLLMESRRFDYIEMGYPISSNLNDIRIDTKELECVSVSLEEILEAESIRTNSLLINYSDVEFNYDFATMKVA